MIQDRRVLTPCSLLLEVFPIHISFSAALTSSEEGLAMQRFLSVLPAFLLLFPAFSLYAQTSNPDEIVVIGSAMLDLPADRILVRISLEYSDKVDGKSAFEQHQAAETTLVALLRLYHIP